MVTLGLNLEKTLQVPWMGLAKAHHGVTTTVSSTPGNDRSMTATHHHKTTSVASPRPQQKQPKQQSSSVAAPRSASSASTMTTVLVGPKQQRFKVSKKLLCASAPFFREHLEPAGKPSSSRPVSLWLPGESTAMFSLFVRWLHAPLAFRKVLEDLISLAVDNDDQTALHDVHWAILRLHLFASHLAIHTLQDLAMDALQDMYLRNDWDVPPKVITYLYTQCEPLQSVRLRRWAVAMVAFSLSAADGTLSSSSLRHAIPTRNDDDDDSSDDGNDLDTSPARFHALLSSLPEFKEDFAIHRHKMEASGLDLRFKNPQLRIPANKLRNDERAFGFRECSFHSHRATVGERRCPHEVRARKRAAAAAASANGVLTGLAGLAVDQAPTGLSAAPSRREAQNHCDAMPLPLFSPPMRPMGHVRAVSSVAT